MAIARPELPSTDSKAGGLVPRALKCSRRSRPPQPRLRYRVIADSRKWLILHSLNAERDLLFLHTFVRGTHGFRTAFRTWGQRADQHGRTPSPRWRWPTRSGPPSERSYARSDLFEKRRGLMDQWAAFVTGGAGAKVVRLHG